MAPASLQSLPTKMHLKILEHLEPDYYEKHVFRGICPQFRALIEPVIEIQSPVYFDKLQEAASAWNELNEEYQQRVRITGVTTLDESSEPPLGDIVTFEPEDEGCIVPENTSYNISYYEPAFKYRNGVDVEALSVCTYCMRLRRRSQFADTVIDTEVEQGFARFCLDCGLQDIGRDFWGKRTGTSGTPYCLGETLNANDRLRVCCRTCHKWKPADYEGYDFGRCEGCKGTGGAWMHTERDEWSDTDDSTEAALEEMSGLGEIDDDDVTDIKATKAMFNFGRGVESDDEFDNSYEDGEEECIDYESEMEDYLTEKSPYFMG